MNFFVLSRSRIQIMGIIAVVFIMLLVNACSSTHQEYIVYVGTYTGKGSDGIYAYRFNSANGDLKPMGLVAKTDNPSFLVINPDGKFLYSVNELDSFQNAASGAVSVFAINKESARLELLQQIPSLGSAPCHVSLDKSARVLMVANYNGGNGAVFPIASDGKLGQSTAFIQDSGSSVNVDRQAAPHAHFIQTTNDNKFVMMTDLGTDQVLEYEFDVNKGTLTSIDSGYVKVVPGSGPRHLAFIPSGKFVYVLNELASTITAYLWDVETRRMKEFQTLSALPANFSGSNTAAEIKIDAKGEFLYVSNRGGDSIGVFRIGTDGRLTAQSWISSGGKTPRHFEIDPTGRWLIAANQDSNNLVVFKIDHATGKLLQTSTSSGVSSPVCVQFLPLKE